MKTSSGGLCGPRGRCQVALPPSPGRINGYNGRPRHKAQDATKCSQDIGFGLDPSGYSGRRLRGCGSGTNGGVVAAGGAFEMADCTAAVSDPVVKWRRTGAFAPAAGGRRARCRNVLCGFYGSNDHANTVVTQHRSHLAGQKRPLVRPDLNRFENSIADGRQRHPTGGNFTPVPCLERTRDNPVVDVDVSSPKLPQINLIRTFETQQALKAVHNSEIYNF
ncbi:hypothetical protein GEV33_008644 [Tenebrio molitor]|uniref:Uncharacterized protein n=1 Tax=Tenebrio molitor TaxID=7067 RepID=A0A8J6L9X8_TENMO|nr:hypothetical protein GEV33_008644 [Tenebrio molitor]